LTIQDTTSGKLYKINLGPALKPISLGQKQMLTALSLAAIIILGAFLRFYHLGVNSIGNTYYAATVQSMLTSWHNFFYASFEPGGSVAVDKPPLGFWIQAASAYMLGVNGFALALPQALAGTLSIPLLFMLVKRHFGTSAGLIAALVLAATPVAISTERNNTIDGLLLFTLLLATWAFIKAVEAGRLRYLLLGVCLVDVGFNIKMMQAFLPLPALYTFYFLGAPHSWPKRIAHLAVATVLLLGVSLSWAIVVDLTPPENRPYIGSSTNNTVMELIVGHNGLNRLWGDRRGDDGPPLSGRPQPGQFGNPPPLQDSNRLDPSARLPGPPAISPGNQPGSPPPAFGNGRPPGPRGGPGGGGPGGPGEIGQPGPLRLFTAPLVTEAGWLLPLALLGIPLTLGILGWQRPLGEKHLALVLWAGWLVTEVIFFSIAAFFHAYYLLMLGPPLAALIGLVGWSIWKLFQTRPGLTCTLLAGLVGGTLVFQLIILPPNYRVWVGAAAIFLAIAGLGLFTLSWWQPSTWAARFGFGLAVLAVTVAPLVWSGLTTFNDNPDVGLPRSGPTAWRPQPANSSDLLSATQQALLDYLLAHNSGADNNYLVATASSHEASPYILATQRPVLTFGGFNGGDQVIDTGQLARLVSDGELRFILGRQEGKPEIAAWITENCTVVDVPGVTQIDRSPVGRPAPGPNRGGEQADILFDCAGYEAD
jgi:4-amino-4-deoxy-L-arabinose transferase-like glycosyltransferase